MERPSAEDVKTLEVGKTYKVNGRKYTINNIGETGDAWLTGARGGWANLVPSVCGKSVQVTTLHSRDWVRSIEAVS